MIGFGFGQLIAEVWLGWTLLRGPYRGGCCGSAASLASADELFVGAGGIVFAGHRARVRSAGVGAHEREYALLAWLPELNWLVQR